MRNFFLSVFFFLVSLQFVSGQNGDLLIKSADKGFYLDHRVAAKENFYSVGRLYNLPPKDIAAYNKLDMNKGLNLGQIIKIPLTTGNFSQHGNSGTPVYYKAGDKEGLMKVSAANNKVLLEDLRKWNKLSNDNIAPNSKLIVGFLVMGDNHTETSKETVAVKTNDDIRKEATTQPIKPEVKKEETTKVIDNEVAKADPPNANHPKDDRGIQTGKLDPVLPVTDVKVSNGDIGYFKPSFDQQIKHSPISKNETVTAGIFKTSSGWQDAKYYLLMDGVQPGTIIKVVNPGNNKMVYAKVLGEMSGIRQNEGLNIRISNAAASALQINETEKFIVKVNY